jgi:hypothetical protein
MGNGVQIHAAGFHKKLTYIKVAGRLLFLYLMPLRANKMDGDANIGNI